MFILGKTVVTTQTCGIKSPTKMCYISGGIGVGIPHWSSNTITGSDDSSDIKILKPLKNPFFENGQRSGNEPKYFSENDFNSQEEISATGTDDDLDGDEEEESGEVGGVAVMEKNPPTVIVVPAGTPESIRAAPAAAVDTAVDPSESMNTVADSPSPSTNTNSRRRKGGKKNGKRRGSGGGKNRNSNNGNSTTTTDNNNRRRIARQSNNGMLLNSKDYTKKYLLNPKKQQQHHQHQQQQQQNPSCHICDSSDPAKSHPTSYMTDLNNPNNLTCWESNPFTVDENVTLTLSLGKKYELTYISLQFCGGAITTTAKGGGGTTVTTTSSGLNNNNNGALLKPDSLAIYKSMDYGRTWQPFQFYSSQCTKVYGRQNR